MKYLPWLPAALISAACAQAATPDAWDEFRAKVEAACVTLAAAQLEKPSALVDPFGSSAYGLALITGRPRGGEADVGLICVYDKVGERAELGSELDLQPLLDRLGD